MCNFNFFIHIFFSFDSFNVLLKYEDNFYMKSERDRQISILHVNIWTKDILNINSGLN